MRPHSDVRNGIITNDTFAANLQTVADAESAYDEYTNPIDFFNRSFITPGLKSLLVNTVMRINGRGGDPVVQMKTGFGGGKTHSLIALYHLINSGESISALAINPTDPTGETLKSVFDEAGVDPAESATAKVAVLSGTERSATEHTKSKNGGYRLNTLWGYMADELAGATGFEFVREASENWTSPGGSELGALFDHVGPCVILIDELVAYARNLPDGRDGSFFTFLQNLTEAASRRSDVALVVTVPEAKEELGGEVGEKAFANVQGVFDAVENVLRRVESISAPLETREAFEVVRRRLFESEPLDPRAVDEVCTAFFNMYSRAKNEFPPHASSGSYHQRLQASYPIHPEVFDRLFEDWSAIHRFQRTRGVLRMMAIAIQQLMNDSNDPMLMPASLPLADQTLSNEFTSILSGNWDPAVGELDGVNSRANDVDRATPRYQRHGGGAAKRIARTVFLGSAPASHTGKTVTGITEDQIRLGAVQPGDGVPVYNEARGALGQTLQHLHVRDGRYFFHTNPNLTKVHQELVRRIADDEVDEKLRLVIEEMVGKRIDDDIRPVIFPADSHEIDDDERLKLVILHPDHHLGSRKDEPDTAITFAEHALTHCGDSQRIRRNTVLFLTAKRDNIRGLRGETRSFLGWDMLARNRSEHNLNTEQGQDARSRGIESYRLVEETLLSTFKEVIAPQQDNPRKSDYRLRPFSVDRRGDSHIVAAAIGALQRREEIVKKIGHPQFAQVINKYFLNGDIDHVPTSEIWDRFVEQVYMHRFLNRGVFEDAIKHAVDAKLYCVASGWDPKDGYSTDATDGFIQDRGRLLVKAKAFKESEELRRKRKRGATSSEDEDEDDPPTPQTGLTDDEEPETEEEHQGVRHVVATKVMDGQAAIEGDYNLIRENIVRALNTIGGDVNVKIVVEAVSRVGFEDVQLNSVRQNGEQLGFEIDSSI